MPERRMLDRRGSFGSSSTFEDVNHCGYRVRGCSPITGLSMYSKRSGQTASVLDTRRSCGIHPSRSRGLKSTSIFGRARNDRVFKNDRLTGLRAVSPPCWEMTAAMDEIPASQNQVAIDSFDPSRINLARRPYRSLQKQHHTVPIWFHFA
jgi:hypothetical protein